MSAAGAIASIHSALTSADTQLEHLFTRLHRDFTRLHRTDTSTPYDVLTRLRKLQSELPQLEKALLSTHQEKVDLATLCRTDLISNINFASQALPSTCPISLVNDLHSSRDALHAIVANVGAANESFVHAAQATRDLDRDFNSALLSKAMVGVKNTSTPSNHSTEDIPEQASKETGYKIESIDNNSGKIKRGRSQMDTKQPAPRKGAGKTSGTGAGKKDAAAVFGRKGSVGSRGSTPTSAMGKASSAGGTRGGGSNSATAKGFQPVEKTKYNRLPRIIKVKGGKLEEVNAFYEKVYNVLSQSSPMTDKKLMTAVGVDNMDKFDVLRGLNLISNRKDGWRLL